MSDDRLRFDDIDEMQLVALARRLAPAARDGGVIHLAGELGAGKTTFARALLTELGVGERVKSPTYSLVESYRAGGVDIHHLDLYRIAAAEELEWLGLAELWGAGVLSLVEWPERGGKALPPPDLTMQLRHAGPNRLLIASAQSQRGQALLAAWKDPGSPGHSP